MSDEKSSPGALMPAFPIRPRVGELPMQPPPPGTELVLPARNDFHELTGHDYEKIAASIGCDARIIHALALQEMITAPFDAYQRPAILYEPTIFSDLAGTRRSEYERTYPLLSVQRYYSRHGKRQRKYGSVNDQWQFLQEAYWLEPATALMDVSWGAFQQVGRFSEDTGAPSVQLMVSNMCRSIQAQVDALVQRSIRKRGMAEAFRTHDFVRIGELYNGNKNIGNDYAKHLKAKYDALD